MRRLLFLILSLLVICPAWAGIIQYDSEASLLSILKTPYLFADFNEYAYGLHRDPLTLSQNGYEAVLSAQRGLYFRNGTVTENCNDDQFIIDFTQSPTPVTVIGGYFWPTDKPDNNLTGYIKIILTLSDGTSITTELNSANYNTFIGFQSTGEAFQTLEIYSLGDLNSPHSWPTLDDLIVGIDPPPTPVPEPSSLILLATGICAISLVFGTCRKRVFSTTQAPSRAGVMFERFLV